MPGGKHKTYWMEGAIVGGVGTGLFFAAAADGLCESNCSAVSVVGSFVLGSLPGIVVGGLVGSLFPKH